MAGNREKIMKEQAIGGNLTFEVIKFTKTDQNYLTDNTDNTCSVTTIQ
jgi:hypothetical protein